jgi:hypothetical protein
MSELTYGHMLQDLRASGVSFPDIAAATGLNPGSLRRLQHDPRPDDGTETYARLRRYWKAMRAMGNASVSL